MPGPRWDEKGGGDTTERYGSKETQTSTCFYKGHTQDPHLPLHPQEGQEAEDMSLPSDP